MARQPYLQINFNKHNPGRSLSTAQIVTAIKDQIAMDHVAPGCRLPPVRALAHQLGISKTTIQLAYDELVAQGLVESTERVGLFVASDPQPVPVAPEALVVPPPCIALPSPAISSQTGTGDRDALNLSSVFIDPELLPHERLSACFRSVVKQPQAYTAYHAQGFPPLRQAIAERLQARGIEASAEDIVITAGSQQALDLVCRVLKQKRIATENPAYSHGKALFEMNRMETLPAATRSVQRYRSRRVGASACVVVTRAALSHDQLSQSHWVLLYHSGIAADFGLVAAVWLWHFGRRLGRGHVVFLRI